MNENDAYWAMRHMVDAARLFDIEYARTVFGSRRKKFGCASFERDAWQVVRALQNEFRNSPEFVKDERTIFAPRMRYIDAVMRELDSARECIGRSASQNDKGVLGMIDALSARVEARKDEIVRMEGVERRRLLANMADAGANGKYTLDECANVEWR